MNFICLNGAIYEAGQPVFTAQNRSFRYGDGLFETIKVHQHKILLAAYHFDRLFLSLRLLKMHLPENLSRDFLAQQILDLCQRNQCLAAARIRLAFYRGEDNVANYVIEAFALAPQANLLNETGWRIDLYPFARKSCDAFANLKTANYLPFVMADMHAQENALDECLVLNTDNHLCEASKANLFLVIKNEVHTPALHQGCVNGVMRRLVIEQLKQNNISVHQHEISEALLWQASEVFLTNAINGIRWVQSFREKVYQNSFVQQFYRATFSTIYQ